MLHIFVVFGVSIQMTMKHILVTGVSTGIGLGIAREFAHHGYHVLGSVRKAEDAQKLSHEIPKNFTPLIFDVTDPTAIQRAVEEVELVVGNEGLLGLINNAGIAVGGPLMHLTLDELRHQFEVNVFGLFSVTQAFLPLLGAKQNSPHPPGRIINISSVAGKVAAPFLGAYVGSKHALEGMSHSLRRELLLYGIDVIIIGPGAIKTSIWGKAKSDDYSRFESTDYKSSLNKFMHLFFSQEEKGFTKEYFGKKVRLIFEKKKPKTRYAIVSQRFSNWIMPQYILPDRVMDKFLKRLFA